MTGSSTTKRPLGFEHALDLGDDAGGIAEMMQTEGNEGAIEGPRLERQLVRFAGALLVTGDRFFMVMADIEHRQRLVDTDDAARLHLLRQRPGNPPGARGQIQNRFVTLQRQRLDQFCRQLAAHVRQAALVELGGMSGIFETRFVIVGMGIAVVMGMAVLFVGMFLAVVMIVAVIAGVPMFLFMRMFRTVRVLMPVRYLPMFVTMGFMRMAVMFVVMMRVTMLVRMLALVLVFVFVGHCSLPIFSFCLFTFSSTFRSLRPTARRSPS